MLIPGFSGLCRRGAPQQCDITSHTVPHCKHAGCDAECSDAGTSHEVALGGPDAAKVGSLHVGVFHRSFGSLTDASREVRTRNRNLCARPYLSWVGL